MAKYGKAFTSDSNFPKIWSRRYPELDGFINVMNSRRKGKTGFIPELEVIVIPRPKKGKFEVLKIF